MARAPGAGAVQEHGLLADPGDHHGLAGFHHPAGDALPQLVAAPAPGLGSQPLGYLDLDFAGAGGEDGDGAPLHAQALGQDFEDLLEIAGQGAGAVQYLGNVEKEGELLRSPRRLQILEL